MTLGDLHEAKELHAGVKETCILDKSLPGSGLGHARYSKESYDSFST